MWEIFQGWESIASAPIDDYTGYLLEFTDEPMLLVRSTEAYSTDLEQQSTTEELGGGTHSLG
jgi:hypothetical protein